jgi:predicted transcriptional regulator
LDLKNFQLNEKGDKAMNDPVSVVSIFADRDTRSVFATVAKERKLRFRDIRVSLNMEPSQAQKSLALLKEADLVKEELGPVEDLNTFYVTTRGLSAERQLNRLAATVS